MCSNVYDDITGFEACGFTNDVISKYYFFLKQENPFLYIQGFNMAKKNSFLAEVALRQHIL